MPIKITINNKEIECEAGEKILDVAKRGGIEIPSFCHHPDFCTKGNCRVCVVEIEGCKKLVPSCVATAQEGMIVRTDTERVVKARDTNIELIYAEHIEKCGTCIWRFECKILHYASKFGIKINYFEDRKASRQIYKFDNAVELDGTQCIDCRNCLDACEMMGINYLEIKDKGARQEIAPSKDRNKHCILCGQCAVHCPVSAAQEQASWNEVEMAIRDDKKIVVAQIPEMIVASIWEDFGGGVFSGPTPKALGVGPLKTVAGALRQLGFDYVFLSDDADGEMFDREAAALKSRVERNDLPLLSAHCPAWVNYIERIRPEFKGKLSGVESPHIIGGRMIKDRLKAQGVDKEIVVVSIMPCTAKKFEISRYPNKPVDAVLTFRELVYMMKKTKIDPTTIRAGVIDDIKPLPLLSGGQAASPFSKGRGVILPPLAKGRVGAGSSLLHLINKTFNTRLKKIDFKPTGYEGIEEALIKVGERKLRIARVTGIKHVSIVLNHIERYDYIDVKACPDGCFGGGGQPIPTSAEIRKRRMTLALGG